MQIVRFSDPLLKDKLPNSQGVYWIIALSPHEDIPRQIARVGGTDPYGVLDIGEAGGQRNSANTIARRLTPCVEAIVHGDRMRPWSKLPKACWVYDMLHADRLLEMYQPKNLGIVFETELSIDDFHAYEAGLTYNYRQRFGELPPFVRKLSEAALLRNFEGKTRAERVKALAGPLQLPFQRYVPEAFIHAFPDL